MSIRSKPVLVLENPQRVPGLLAAAAVGWLFVSAGPFLLSFAGGVWSLLFSASPSPTTVPDLQKAAMWGSFYFALAISGLPVALGFCFLFGYPAWVVASQNGLKQRRHAMRIGALFGTIFYVVLGLGNLFRLGTQLATDASGIDVQAALVQVLVLSYGAAIGAVAGLAAWCAGGDKTLVKPDAGRQPGEATS